MNFVLSLISFFSAEEINYKVKLINDIWDEDLANPESQLYIERENTIISSVKLVFLFFFLFFFFFILATVIRYISLHFILSCNLISLYSGALHCNTLQCTELK